MIPDSNETKQLNTKIAAAMALGYVLKIGIKFNGNSDLIAIPLIKEVAILRDLSALLFLKAALIFSYLRNGFTSSLFFWGALTTLLNWLAHYSGTGAFVPQLVLNCLLIAIIIHSQEDHLQIRKLAILFSSTVFILAALQKMNSNYFSGIEFQSRSGFAVYYLQYLGELPFWLRRFLLPAGSVIIEMAIGIGLLVRPKLFAHLCVLFVIALMFLHPALSLPYLTFAGTCCLIDSEFALFLKRLAGKIPIESPFFWLVFAIILDHVSQVEAQLQIRFPLICFAIAIALFLVHGFYILKSYRTAEWLNENLPSLGGDLFIHSKAARLATLLIALMWSLPIFFSLGAPAPIGFSMFSGQTLNLNPSKARNIPTLKIDDDQICENLNRRLVRTVVVDVSFSIGQRGCRILAPTVSGLEYIREKICTNSPAACAKAYLE